MTKALQPQDKYVLRLPDGLRDRIKARAAAHSRSMNAEIVRVLEREYPAPWSMDERVADLLRMMTVLKGGASTDERIVELVSEIEETIVGIVSRRVPGVDDETRARISRLYYRHKEHEAENEP